MPRTDRASRTIAAPAEALYRAFVDPAALVSWLPPDGMRGEVLAFDPRPGGDFRVALRYAEAGPGKTTPDADFVRGRFAELVPGERVVWKVAFDSDDRAFAGEMTVAWSFAPAEGGTDVEVVCADVPDGVGAEDHAAGLASSLANLAALVE